MTERVVEKFVGVDVSKSTLDVCIDSPSEVMHVDYDDKGIKALCARLKSVAPTLIVMEATGGLEMRLACEMAAQGLNVAVINPRRSDCPSRFESLAGVGVAFRLAQAVLRAVAVDPKGALRPDRSARRSTRRARSSSGRCL